jgi:arylsulfatase A-like enzyme
VLLVVMSDHGEAFGEHHNFRHGDDGPRVTLHEEVVHVPLVVWGPSMVARGSSRPGRRCSATLLPRSWRPAGIPKGLTMTGENLWPLMSVDASGAGPVPSWRASLSRGRPGVGAALPRRTSSLFELCAVGPCRLELYALDRDPGERRNLAKSHPRAVAALIGRLSRRVVSLTGVLGMEGMPPMCPLCGYDQTAAFLGPGPVGGEVRRTGMASTPRRAGACARSATPTADQ